MAQCFSWQLFQYHDWGQLPLARHRIRGSFKGLILKLRESQISDIKTFLYYVPKCLCNSVLRYLTQGLKSRFMAPFAVQIITVFFYHSPIYQIGEGTGDPLQYSCLENPMDGRAWQAAVHGVAKSWTRLSDFPLTFHFRALEKEMATQSSVLAWRIPEMGEPGGLPSMGSNRVGHN